MSVGLDYGAVDWPGSPTSRPYGEQVLVMADDRGYSEEAAYYTKIEAIAPTGSGDGDWSQSGWFRSGPVFPMPVGLETDVHITGSLPYWICVEVPQGSGVTVTVTDATTDVEIYASQDLYMPDNQYKDFSGTVNGDTSTLVIEAGDIVTPGWIFIALISPLSTGATVLVVDDEYSSVVIDPMRASLVTITPSLGVRQVTLMIDMPDDAHMYSGLAGSISVVAGSIADTDDSCTVVLQPYFPSTDMLGMWLANIGLSSDQAYFIDSIQGTRQYYVLHADPSDCANSQPEVEIRLGYQMELQNSFDNINAKTPSDYRPLMFSYYKEYGVDASIAVELAYGTTGQMIVQYCDVPFIADSAYSDSPCTTSWILEDGKDSCTIDFSSTSPAFGPYTYGYILLWPETVLPDTTTYLTLFENYRSGLDASLALNMEDSDMQFVDVLIPPQGENMELTVDADWSGHTGGHICLSMTTSHPVPNSDDCDIILDGEGTSTVFPIASSSQRAYAYMTVTYDGQDDDLVHMSLSVKATLPILDTDTHYFGLNDDETRAYFRWVKTPSMDGDYIAVTIEPTPVPGMQPSWVNDHVANVFVDILPAPGNDAAWSAHGSGAQSVIIPVGELGTATNLYVTVESTGRCDDVSLNMTVYGQAKNQITPLSFNSRAYKPNSPVNEPEMYGYLPNYRPAALTLSPCRGTPRILTGPSPSDLPWGVEGAFGQELRFQVGQALPPGEWIYAQVIADGDPGNTVSYELYSYATDYRPLPGGKGLLTIDDVDKDGNYVVRFRPAFSPYLSTSELSYGLMVLAQEGHASHVSDPVPYTGCGMLLGSPMWLDSDSGSQWFELDTDNEVVWTTNQALPGSGKYWLNVVVLDKTDVVYSAYSPVEIYEGMSVGGGSWWIWALIGVLVVAAFAFWWIKVRGKSSDGGDDVVVSSGYGSLE
eukprot:gnl/Dysnectes_brevis/147_a172_2866.p1 GENE.gnl/Dysnectes_brevis/147_a172_2866~~gnl/Dysnectes_brevis/147_a172_2866.p1  ORF type:complete len:932 (-),score=408.63 gnl/Dysnectes_brevis/147_a172_2866:36-2831(-)